MVANGHSESGIRAAECLAVQVLIIVNCLTGKILFYNTLLSVFVHVIRCIFIYNTVNFYLHLHLYSYIYVCSPKCQCKLSDKMAFTEQHFTICIYICNTVFFICIFIFICIGLCVCAPQCKCSSL